MRVLDRLSFLLHLQVIEPRAERLHGNVAVLVLGLFGRGHHDPCGNVRDPDGGVGCVHVLPACTRGPVGIDADLVGWNVDLDRVIDDRVDPDRRERGMPPRLAVEGRDPHKPVHARLGLQPAEHVLALDLVGGGLDARLLARGLGLQLDLEAARLGPAHIHARKHRRPVAAFRTARTRVYFDERVIAVGLAGQQRLDLLGGGLLADIGESFFRFADNLGILLGFAEFDQVDIVRQSGFQRLITINRVGQLLAFAHDLLRVGGIVPKGRVLGTRIKLFKPVRSRVPAQPLAQQLQRLLDFGDNRLGFGFHVMLRGTTGMRPVRPVSFERSGNRRDNGEAEVSKPRRCQARYHPTHPAPRQAGSSCLHRYALTSARNLAAARHRPRATGR